MTESEIAKLELLQKKGDLEKKPFSEYKEKTLLRINKEIEIINKQLQTAVIPKVRHNICRSGKNVTVENDNEDSLLTDEEILYEVESRR